MEINVKYEVIENLIRKNSQFHLNTTLVLEMKEEIETVLAEELLKGKKIGLLEAFLISSKTLGIRA